MAGSGDEPVGEIDNVVGAFLDFLRLRDAQK